jgi:predicted lipid carrier protein YhbT
MPYCSHSYFYNYQFILLRWRFIYIATPCLFFILSLLFSCTSQKVNQTSSDRLYQKNNNTLNAKYTIYHVNDSLSQFFYEISNEILLYKKEEASADFYSQVKLLVKISTEDNLN